MSRQKEDPPDLARPSLSVCSTCSRPVQFSSQGKGPIHHPTTGEIVCFTCAQRDQGGRTIPAGGTLPLILCRKEQNFVGQADPEGGAQVGGKKAYCDPCHEAFTIAELSLKDVPVATKFCVTCNHHLCMNHVKKHDGNHILADHQDEVKQCVVSMFNRCANHQQSGWSMIDMVTLRALCPTCASSPSHPSSPSPSPSLSSLSPPSPLSPPSLSPSPSSVSLSSCVRDVKTMADAAPILRDEIVKVLIDPINNTHLHALIGVEAPPQSSSHHLLDVASDMDRVATRLEQWCHQVKGVRDTVYTTFTEWRSLVSQIDTLKRLIDDVKDIDTIVMDTCQDHINTLLSMIRVLRGLVGTIVEAAKLVGIEMKQLEGVTPEGESAKNIIQGILSKRAVVSSLVGEELVSLRTLRGIRSILEQGDPLLIGLSGKVTSMILNRSVYVERNVVQVQAMWSEAISIKEKGKEGRGGGEEAGEGKVGEEWGVDGVIEAIPQIVNAMKTESEYYTVKERWIDAVVCLTKGVAGVEGKNNQEGGDEGERKVDSKDEERAIPITGIAVTIWPDRPCGNGSGSDTGSGEGIGDDGTSGNDGDGGVWKLILVNHANHVCIWTRRDANATNAIYDIRVSHHKKGECPAESTSWVCIDSDLHRGKKDDVGVYLHYLSGSIGEYSPIVKLQQVTDRYPYPEPGYKMIDMELNPFAAKKIEKQYLCSLSLEDSHLPSEIKYRVGDMVDVYEQHKRWCYGWVKSIDEMERKVTIQFEGWGTQWDEKHDIDSANLQPYRSETKGMYTGWTWERGWPDGLYDPPINMVEFNKYCNIFSFIPYHLARGDLLLSDIDFKFIQLTCHGWISSLLKQEPRKVDVTPIERFTLISHLKSYIDLVVHFLRNREKYDRLPYGMIRNLSRILGNGDRRRDWYRGFPLGGLPLTKVVEYANGYTPPAIEGQVNEHMYEIHTLGTVPPEDPSEYHFASAWEDEEKTEEIPIILSQFMEYFGMIGGFYSLYKYTIKTECIYEFIELITLVEDLRARNALDATFAKTYFETFKIKELVKLMISTMSQETRDCIHDEVFKSFSRYAD